MLEQADSDESGQKRGRRSVEQDKVEGARHRGGGQAGQSWAEQRGKEQGRPNLSAA